MNNLLLIISIIGIFSIMLLIKKFLGKEGLIGWMGIASILANIMIIKSVDLLGISSTLGNVLFASNFLATDILTENYGYEEAKKGIKFGIISVLVFMLITQVAVLYIPNSEDIAQKSFETLFSLVPRITIASVSLFALSNIIDIKLYEYLRKKTNGKKMWLRNNLCTILCNGGENFIFYLIAFGGIMNIQTIIAVGISATIIETLIALCDTPFLYISKKVKDKIYK
jgi:uncharacterized integral membrane protein (TIGR00697 family)